MARQYVPTLLNGQLKGKARSRAAVIYNVFKVLVSSVYKVWKFVVS